MRLLNQTRVLACCGGAHAHPCMLMSMPFHPPCLDHGPQLVLVYTMGKETTKRMAMRSTTRAHQGVRQEGGRGETAASPSSQARRKNMMARALACMACSPLTLPSLAAFIAVPSPPHPYSCQLQPMSVLRTRMHLHAHAHAFARAHAGTDVCHGA